MKDTIRYVPIIKISCYVYIVIKITNNKLCILFWKNIYLNVIKVSIHEKINISVI